MANLNRIKVVLVEQQKTGNGWLSNWANPLAQSANGAVIPFSQTWQH